MNVQVENGKYEYRFYPDGESEVLRYGEPWRDTVGDKFIYCMASELNEARDQIDDLTRKLDLARLALEGIRKAYPKNSGTAIALLCDDAISAIKEKHV